MSTMNDVDELSGWALTAESQPELFPGAAEDATRTPETAGADAYATGARRGLSEAERDEQDRAMAAACAAGESQRSVAARFGVSFGTVNRAVHRFGNSVVPGAVPLPEVETIVGDQYHGDGADDLPVSAVGERPEPVAATSGATGAVTALVPADVLQARRATVPEELPVGPEREVFTHSEATRAVWHAARAKGAGPWSVLGYVMAMTVAATGPHLRLPPLVGGDASLNLLVGLVARSGGGKGVSRAVARSMFRYCDHTGEEVNTPMFTPGSGEGIAELFTRREGKGDDGEPTDATPDRALFDETEISVMAKRSARQGSTLMPMLLKFAMGEDLGNLNGSAASSRMVPDHSYRGCLTVGIQAKNAGVILDDVGSGAPQRWLFLPTFNHGRPEVRPKTPPVHDIRLPSGARAGNSPLIMGVPETVEDIVFRESQDRLDDTPGMEEYSHRTLTREKVSAALALMAGRTDVTEVDWSAAGAVMALSDTTRRMCREACRGAAVEAAAARRIEDAEGRDQAAEHMAEKYAATVRKRVLSLLSETTGTLFGDLRDRLNGKTLQDGRSQKDRLPEVLQALVDDGLILPAETVDGNGNPTTEYRLSRQ